jgi:hypothetical protein
VRRLRYTAFALFVLISLGGSLFYLREPLHQARRTNAVEWWAGITGRAVSHHRPGIQLAWLDPATGRLTGVRDVFGLPGTVRQAMADLPPNRWLVITVLQMGESEVTLQLGALLKEGAGWSGDLAPVAEGAAALVLGRGPGGLQVVGERISGEPLVDFRLKNNLRIIVKPY